MLVSLQQEDRRKYKKEGKGDSIPIGFEIFKVGSEFVQQPCSILTMRSLADRGMIVMTGSGSPLNMSFACVLHSVTRADIRQTI